MITPEQLATSGSESGHQKALFAWAQQSGIPELKWLFAVPNGFYGSAAQKSKMKAEGLKSGVSDVMLLVSKWTGDPASSSLIHYNGLIIEMKTEAMRNRKNGGLSDEQKEFGEFVTRQGYRFVIVYSWIEARDAILQYLGRV